MERIRPFLLSSVMTLALVSAPLSFENGDAFASSASVKIRGSDKDGYSRLVFDRGHPVTYKANITGQTLTLSFSEAADFVPDGTTPTSLSRITAYKVIDPKTVEIRFPKGQDIRHFMADNRLIIDIKGPAVAPKKSEQAAAVVPKKTAPAAPEKSPVNLVQSIEPAQGTEKGKDSPTETKQPPAPAKDIKKNETPVNPPSAVSPPPPEEKTPLNPASAVEVKPTVIKITSTESLAIAAFEHNGYLRIVESAEGIKLAPVVDGGTTPFPTFERTETTGASAFRAKLPSDYAPGTPQSASGEGLVWKLELNKKPAPDKKPVPLKRVTGEAAQGKGPALLWPVKNARRIADIADKDTGDLLKAVLVDNASSYSGPAQKFVEFDILPSPIGMVIRPKADDVKVSMTPDGVLITRPDGLTLSSESDVVGASPLPSAQSTSADENAGQPVSRIFDFKEWHIGEPKDLSENQRVILGGLGNMNDEKRAENLIRLARLMLSFNYAPEASGYLDLTQHYVPDLDTNPEFLALRGAAETLSRRQKEAYADFSAAGLNDIGEIAYWKAYTLAKLDDWQQAAKILPDNVSPLADYPQEIAQELGLTLAEVALRDGNIKKADAILSQLAPYREKMTLPYASAYDYLKGEYARQTGKPEDAKKLWEALTTGADDLYRAKARFALTMLKLGRKDITPDKAIDTLEGLRYAWRGDDLEVSINNSLAKVYLDKGEPIKALTMMNYAYALNPTTEQGKQIDADRRSVFKGLFEKDKIKKLTPVDALTVYNEFSDLIPEGAEGDAIARQLAERLADADLLPRATALLKKQVDGTLQGLEGADVAVRLAALQAQDGKPDDSLKSLDKAENFLKGLPPSDVLPRQQTIGMLRAKAYSLQGKPEEAFAAMSLLPQDDTTLRLKADIAWKNKKWQDAADNIEQLITAQNISLTRPLTDEQADLILNWAVALYLADNRYVLANLRERYSDAMAATPKAKKFDVVTRPRQASLLSDRETIGTIIDETVIFKDFLNSFKATDIPVSPRSAAASGASPQTAESASAAKPAPVPEPMTAIPGIKADEVLGD